jgi:hypothetical protein
MVMESVADESKIEVVCDVIVVETEDEVEGELISVESAYREALIESNVEVYKVVVIGSSVLVTVDESLVVKDVTESILFELDAEVEDEVIVIDSDVGTGNEVLVVASEVNVLLEAAVV